MPLPIFALALATFAVGTSEFIIAGLLPRVAADLGVTIPTAGYLISAYAAGVAVGGPIVAILTAGFERKATLLGLMGLFIIGSGLCALAPSYGWLIGARIVIAITHGGLIGFASVAAAEMVDEQRRGRAIAIVLAGITSSNVFGIPIGTAIGGAFGWRVAFWAIVALGVVSLAGIAALVPRMATDADRGPNITAEIRALGRPAVYTSLAIVVLAATAYFGVFAFIAPLLLEAAHVPNDWLPIVLAVVGVASVAGILIGGRLADWRLLPSVFGITVVQLAINALLPFVVGGPIVATVALFVWTIAGVPLIATPLQTRILNAARDAPNLASTLISSAFNVGIAIGAAAGATALEHGSGYAGLPWLALCMLVPAALLAFAELGRERRTRLAAA
ncbi:MAG TPA: MFS transporter [Bauldia sp.]|nr:MFS transporter [Bauldia sp.]